MLHYGRSVDLICEEAQHGAESIAETLADQEHIRYRNIDMPPRRRAEIGIPPVDTIDVPGSEITPEQLANWNALRESHMVQELLGAVAGARAMIVICGVSHMPTFAQALGTKFARVERHDVTRLDWFDKALL
jgi:hypothetical protein